MYLKILLIYTVLFCLQVFDLAKSEAVEEVSVVCYFNDIE